jgi:hypothetical protein
VTTKLVRVSDKARETARRLAKRNGWTLRETYERAIALAFEEDGPVEWYAQTAPGIRTKFRKTSLGVVRTEETVSTLAIQESHERDRLDTPDVV